MSAAIKGFIVGGVAGVVFGVLAGAMAMCVLLIDVDEVD